ncbi:hypothetical protein Trydic_g18517 [Trypoxylus dichotomus]
MVDLMTKESTTPKSGDSLKRFPSIWNSNTKFFHTFKIIANLDDKQRIFVDYVMPHVPGDQQPHLQVSILGHHVVGLLERGSNRTLVGPKGPNLLQRHGLTLQSYTVECAVHS